VTRKWSEARSYLASGGDILRVLIPVALQSRLHVDPDSQFGLYMANENNTFDGKPYSTTLLRGMDRLNGRLGPDAYYILTAAISDPEVRDLLPELYDYLVAREVFLPGKEAEPITDLTHIQIRPVRGVRHNH
jgi:hypothetical protein